MSVGPPLFQSSFIIPLKSPPSLSLLPKADLAVIFISSLVEVVQLF